MAKKSREDIMAEKMLKDGKTAEEVMASTGKSRAVIQAMMEDIKDGRL